ncbi:response regulator [Desulfoplanes sp.]
MKTIVLVEGNKYVRQFISRELLSQGYRTREFKNGRELLRELHTTGDDEPIVIERDLPRIDIHQAISTIRRVHPDQPIIVHSFDDENGFGGDPNLYVAKKQSDLAELITTLNSCSSTTADGHGRRPA